MKKKTKETDYSFLDGLKPLYVLNKKGSPHLIEFFVYPNDDWFIYVITRKKNKKEITSDSLIIRKDVPGWLVYHEGMGWEYTKMYEEQNLSCV